VYYKLDKDKKPVKISLEEIKEEAWEGRVVQQDIVAGHLISTVFLVIDHRHSDEGPPLLFETMVFEGVEAGRDIACNRYSFFEEALQGHIEMVREYLPEGVLYCYDLEFET